MSRVIDFLLTSYEPDFAVVQGNRLLGVVTRADVLKALATEIEDVYVATIMKRDVMKVDAARPLDEVRQEMMEKEERVAAVYRDEAYLGLVSLEDIAEALLVVGFRNRQEERRKAVQAQRQAEEAAARQREQHQQQTPQQRPQQSVLQGYGNSSTATAASTRGFASRSANANPRNH